MRNTLRLLPILTIVGVASAFPFVSGAAPHPLNVTAKDFLTKVYGVCPTYLSKSEAADMVSAEISISPVEEGNGLWIEGDDGFAVSYFGSTPVATAMAIYDEEERLSDFGYYFEFGYEGGTRDAARCEQSDFCGCLLQELSDIGARMSCEEENDSLFNVSGSCYGVSFRLRLIEENFGAPDDEGAFLLLMTISPGNEVMLTDL